MDLTNFICIYLMTCFPADKENNQITNGCPTDCECYTAPEDGDGLDTAYSMICNFKGDFISELNEDLRKKSVNTLIVDNDSHKAPNPFFFTSGFQLNNLVLRNSWYAYFSLRINDLDRDKLNVLTLIGTHIETNWMKVEWIPNGFKQLKAIYIKDGSFDIFDDRLAVDSMNNVISLTVDNANLKIIEKNALSEFKSLKMITIIQNTIDTLNWLPINCPIWYLDVRNNRIREFPLELAQSLISLRTLKLGGNNIHQIGFDTAQILMSQLKEFSFQPVKGTTRKSYFYPTKDMIWTCTHSSCSEDVAKKYPNFLYGDLVQSDCIVDWNDKTSQCGYLYRSSYSYPEKAITNRLAVIKDKYQFTYMNKLNLIAGAVVPHDWQINNLKQWLDLVSLNGNTVKLQINIQEWFDQTPGVFRIMVKDLEDGIKIAQDNNMFVIINLWKKSDSISRFLVPNIDASTYANRFENLAILAKDLGKYENIAGWNLFDEPENLIETSEIDPDDCLNANLISKGTPGVVGVSIKTVQRFISMQAQVIHKNAPGHLVTVTIKDTTALSYWDANNIGFNHFEDQCLNMAMTDSNCVDGECVLDYYSILVSEDSMENRPKFGPKLISEKSIKPVVIIAEENNDGLKSFTDKLMRIDWNFEGILGTFSDDDDDSNSIIQDALQTYYFDHETLILNYGYINPDLEEN